MVSAQLDGLLMKLKSVVAQYAAAGEKVESCKGVEYQEVCGSV